MRYKFVFPKHSTRAVRAVQLFVVRPRTYGLRRDTWSEDMG
jgi:hypothetical protein